VTGLHDRARAVALSLPEAHEEDHHGRPSFRVANRIFATLWDGEHMNVMLDEDGIRTFAEAEPAACSEFWWGKRLRAVHVDLRVASDELLKELLTQAWERKAPKAGRGSRPRPRG
jgi:hypothetical protein